MIEIDAIDKRLLFELDKNARQADTQLAKKIGRSKESVRYRLKRLQEQGIIKGFSIWVDVALLGYMSGKIYLSLANKPALLAQFTEEVLKDKRLFWFGLADGAWNAGLTFFVKTNREFFELKNKLFSTYKDLILHSETAVLVSVDYDDKKFLFKEGSSWNHLLETIDHKDLDSIDQAILKELYKNSRISLTSLAQKTQSTIDVVRYRMKNMKENGIIRRYLAVIDYNVLGYESFKTFLYFSKLTDYDEARLMEFCLGQENIIHLVKQISPWDIELEIICENYNEYNTIIDALRLEFSDMIRRIDTAIMREDYVFPSKELILTQ